MSSFTSAAEAFGEVDRAEALARLEELIEERIKDFKRANAGRTLTGTERITINVSLAAYNLFLVHGADTKDALESAGWGCTTSPGSGDDPSIPNVQYVEPSIILSRRRR